MSRTGALCAAAVCLGGLAHAAGGPIRTGEHDGFSRLVMHIGPATEWSLETTDGVARVFLPGRELEFLTGAVFDLIPKTRVQAVRTDAGPAGTSVEVDLGCDCRVSASFVNGRYLALDVADRDFVGPSDEETDKEIAALAEERALERADREATIVTSAEEVLIRQLERAASQGLIALRGDPSEELDGVETLKAKDEPPDAQVAPPQAPVAPSANGLAPGSPGPAVSPEMNASTAGLNDLLDHDQIRATTVYDRDRPGVEKSPKWAQSPSSRCLTADQFDIGFWSTEEPLREQAARLWRVALGEFDVPNADAIDDLARLYVHHGFGLEAERLLESFGQSDAERALIVDMARAVEGRPVSEDGPLALSEPCPGPHAFWLAVSGGTAAFVDDQQFEAAREAFADLPPQLRRLMGPRLMEALIDADRADTARVIYRLAQRSTIAPTPELRLAAARLEAAEGHSLTAMTEMNALIVENSANSNLALMAVVDLALEQNLTIPSSLITDLRAAIVQYRGMEEEAALRRLLVLSLARAHQLPEAIKETHEAEARLGAPGQFSRLRTDILAAAVPDQVGPVIYAEIVLEEAPDLDVDLDSDPARRAIANRLIDLALPKVALEVIAPAQRRGDKGARRIAAEAHLRLGEADAALAVLGDLSTPQDVALRSRAFALGGQFDAAVEALDAAGFGLSADDYAWPAGQWARTSATTEDPRREAMAAFMASNSDDAEAATLNEGAGTVTPETAFAEPLPDIGRPSLSSARQLLENGGQIESFVLQLLEPDASDDDQ